ncbi:unnamed protein product [Protopolystoma xenopodis]|uniref:Uncharacterized protein n=1 Tax=Protopolystoma xenopodis TaxID=117903 RepID=A0A3S5BF15_9PLAT|nr:unnamed protein product [Protopolystoma xenopodis]
MQSKTSVRLLHLPLQLIGLPICGITLTTCCWLSSETDFLTLSFSLSSPPFVLSVCRLLYQSRNRVCRSHCCCGQQQDLLTWHRLSLQSVRTSRDCGKAHYQHSLSLSLSQRLDTLDPSTDSVAMLARSAGAMGHNNNSCCCAVHRRRQ